MKRLKENACRIQNSQYSFDVSQDVSFGGSSSSNSVRLLEDITDSGNADSASAAESVSPHSVYPQSPQSPPHGWPKPWNKIFLDADDPSLGLVIWPEDDVDNETAVSARSVGHVVRVSLSDENDVSIINVEGVMSMPPSNAAPVLRESRRKRRRMNSVPPGNLH